MCKRAATRAFSAVAGYIVRFLPSAISSYFSYFFFLFFTPYLFLSSRFHSSTACTRHPAFPPVSSIIPTRNTVWFIRPLCTSHSTTMLDSENFLFWFEEEEEKGAICLLLFSATLLFFRFPFFFFFYHESIAMPSNISQLRGFMGHHKDTGCVSVAWWLTWLNFYCSPVHVRLILQGRAFFSTYAVNLPRIFLLKENIEACFVLLREKY